MLTIAQYISYALGLYVLLGLLFGIYFILRGLRGESLAGRGVLLRAMFLPGSILLWPVLLKARQ